ncbi:YnjH family protein [Vibrio chagasii]|nr:YnjH family protein [Vibrio chagasii]
MDDEVNIQIIKSVLVAEITCFAQCLPMRIKVISTPGEGCGGALLSGQQQRVCYYDDQGIQYWAVLEVSGVVIQIVPRKNDF